MEMYRPKRVGEAEEVAMLSPEERAEYEAALGKLNAAFAAFMQTHPNYLKVMSNAEKMLEYVNSQQYDITAESLAEAYTVLSRRRELLLRSDRVASDEVAPVPKAAAVPPPIIPPGAKVTTRLADVNWSQLRAEQAQRDETKRLADATAADAAAAQEAARLSQPGYWKNGIWTPLTPNSPHTAWMESMHEANVAARNNVFRTR